MPNLGPDHFHFSVTVDNQNHLKPHHNTQTRWIPTACTGQVSRLAPWGPLAAPDLSPGRRSADWMNRKRIDLYELTRVTRDYRMSPSMTTYLDNSLSCWSPRGGMKSLKREFAVYRSTGIKNHCTSQGLEDPKQPGALSSNSWEHSSAPIHKRPNFCDFLCDFLCVQT